MSQPSTQTQPPASAVPSEHTGSITSSNTTQNAGINAQSQPNASSPSAGTGGAAGAGGGLRDPNAEITSEQAQQEGLPEQKHAGAVGYGPDFANKNKPTVGDKITGIKEQLVGKVTKNPELAQKGHERKTGDLKRKEAGEDETDPFATEEKKEPATTPASNAQGPGTTANANTSTPITTSDTAPSAGGTAGRSAEVDTAAGESRLTNDPSHPAAQDQGVQRAAAV